MIRQQGNPFMHLLAISSQEPDSPFLAAALRGHPMASTPPPILRLGHRRKQPHEPS
jgi:hypothetical protein